MNDTLLFLGILVVAIASVVRDIRRSRQIAMLELEIELLKEYLVPYGDIVAAAIELETAYEAEPQSYAECMRIEGELKNALKRLRERRPKREVVADAAVNR